MMTRTNFYDEIRRNKILSWVLFLLSIVITTLFLWVLGKAFGVDAFVMFIIATIISFLSSYFSYIYSDKIALSMVNAVEADEKKYRHLHNIIEGLAIAAGLPKPKVYIMPSEEINAFATGKDPEHAVICVTQGALKYLNDAELEGVLAHEMSHIKHYDIRYVTMATIVLGLISVLSQMFLRSLWFGYGDRDERNGIFIIIGIALAIISPIILRLVYFAISRKREFMADAGAVELTRNPKGLINALLKIKDFYENYQKTKIPKATAPMYISDPYSIIANAFSTHPPIDERIRRLKSM